MHAVMIAARRSGIARRVIGSLIAAVVAAILLGIAGAYLDPALRRAVIFAGFGMC